MFMADTYAVPPYLREPAIVMEQAGSSPDFLDVLSQVIASAKALAQAAPEERASLAWNDLSPIFCGSNECNGFYHDQSIGLGYVFKDTADSGAQRSLRISSDLNNFFRVDIENGESHTDFSFDPSEKYYLVQLNLPRDQKELAKILEGTEETFLEILRSGTSSIDISLTDGGLFWKKTFGTLALSQEDGACLGGNLGSRHIMSLLPDEDAQSLAALIGIGALRLLPLKASVSSKCCFTPADEGTVLDGTLQCDLGFNYGINNLVAGDLILTSTTQRVLGGFLKGTFAVEKNGYLKIANIYSATALVDFTCKIERFPNFLSSCSGTLTKNPGPEQTVCTFSGKGAEDLIAISVAGSCYSSSFSDLNSGASS